MSLFSFFRSKKSVDSQYNEAPATPEQSPKNENDFTFVDETKTIYVTHPVMRAKDVPVYTKGVRDKKKEEFSFPLCPGMWDYSTMGYIIPSWTTYHIKANRAGIVTVLGGGTVIKGTPFRDPIQMDHSLIDGYVDFENVIPNAYNFMSPWKVFSNTKNISMLILPATYHSKPELFENLFICPGVVDYDSFRVLNFICAIRKKCEFTIHPGDPLLHVIPFYNSEFSAGYGPISEEQEAEIKYNPIWHEKSVYKKKMKVKKTFVLDKSAKKQENKE